MQMVFPGSFSLPIRAGNAGSLPAPENASLVAKGDDL